MRETIAELRRVLRNGGLLFLTVPSRLDEGVEHEEIEPGTYVPRSRTGEGVPHHVFSLEELQAECAGFRTLEPSTRGSVVHAYMGLSEKPGGPTTRYFDFSLSVLRTWTCARRRPPRRRSVSASRPWGVGVYRPRGHGRVC